MDRKVVGVSGYLSGYLSICLSVCLCVSLSVCLPGWLAVCQSVCLFVYPSVCLTGCLSVSLSICLSVYPSICLCVYLSVYLSAWLAVCQSVCLSVYLSVYLSICLSICLSANWKMKLLCETSLKCGSWKLKTKFFSETSFNLEADNIRNAAILQNLLQASKLSTSETKQFCETSFKNGKLSAELTPWYQCVLRFFHPISHKYCAATRKWGQVMGRSAAPVTQNHLRKPDDLMLQNATVLRKSASDLRTCLAHMPLVLRLPRDMHLCRPSSNVSHLPSFLKLLQNRHILLILDTMQNPSHLYMFLQIWLRNVLCATAACTCSASQLPKVVREWCVFWHFGFDMCFAPQQRALLRHLNCQNWPENGVSSAFWLRHTSTCASRHNRVHFSNISTSKRAPNMWCFWHFNFETRFVPQGRALLNIATSKSAPNTWSFFDILTLTCPSRHNGVQLFISHLHRWLRTRRFSELTFRPSRAAENIGKPSFSQLFYLFTHLDLLSSAFLFSDILLLPFSSLPLLWLFPPLLFHLSILSEVWLLNFLRIKCDFSNN